MTDAVSPSERAAARALEAAGFEEVRFLPPTGRERCADLLARRAGELWAVEVREATRPLRADGSFEPLSPAKPLPYPTLADYLALLWREKRGQLEATARAHGCARAMLLVVVEGTPAPAWRQALESARRDAGAPAGVVLALRAAGGLLAEPPLDGLSL